MNKTNQFHAYNPGWSLEQWLSIAKVGTYTRIDSLSELPQGCELPRSLTGKLNAITFVCSGCTTYTAFIAQYYRVDPDDKNGWAIDQQTLVACFDNDSGEYFGGHVMHGGWPGYTTNPTALEAMLSASGLTANVHFTGKPSQKHGSLEDLRKEGIIEGIETPLEVVAKKKESKGNGPS